MARDPGDWHVLLLWRCFGDDVLRSWNAVFFLRRAVDPSSILIRTGIRRSVRHPSMQPDDTMKLAANFLLVLGLAMLAGYYVIGLRTGSGLIHEPFVMLPASLVLVLGGLVARFVLPRL